MSENESLENLAKSIENKIIAHAEALETPIVEDLGDYIPFLSYFGKHELCERHISECSGQILDPSRPTEREDTLLGLVEHYRQTRNKYSLELARSYVNYLFSHYFKDGSLGVPAIKYVEHTFEHDRPKTVKNKVLKATLKFVHHLLGTRLAIPRNGIFIELLTDMYDLTEESQFLRMAENLANSWLANKTFQNTGLFPSVRLNPLKNKYVILAKDNSALVNGLIALYEETRNEAIKEAILKWFESVQEKCFDKTVYGKYDLKTGRKKRPELMFAMAVIDVLCYAFFVLKKKELLSLAEDIARFWIDLQSDIGLFPEEIKSCVSHQDFTNDFAVSLWRLYELTRDNYYLEASEKAMQGLFQYHAFNLKVNFRSGEVVNAHSSPKYVFLMSKPIILLKEKAIYENKKVFKLLRDR